MKIVNKHKYCKAETIELQVLISNVMDGSEYDDGVIECLSNECLNLRLTMAKLIEILVEFGVIQLQNVDKIVTGKTYKIGDLSLDE